MFKLISTNVKYKTTLTIILLLSGLFVIAGCGSGGGGATAGGSGVVTPVSINLSVPDNNNGSSSGGLSIAAAPEAVNLIEVRISGPGMDTIVDPFNVSPGDNVTRVYEVKTGDNRTFAIMAYSAPLTQGGDPFLLYDGMTTLSLGGAATTVDITLALFDIAHAFTYLNTTGDIVGSEDLFRAAEIKHNGEGSVSEIQANFFHAISRVLALWSDRYSYTGVDYGLYAVTEVTDIIYDISLNQQNPDCAAFHSIDHFDSTITDPLDAYFTAIFCPDDLPDFTSLDLQELQDSIDNTLRPALEAALLNLDAVPVSFNFGWTDAISWTQADASVESDYGDVLMLKAIFQTLLASIETQDMTLKKTYLQNALSNINNTDGAMNVIRIQEGDPQDDDWINLTDPSLWFVPINIIQGKHDESVLSLSLW
jgi:hypothetical protein